MKEHNSDSPCLEADNMGRRRAIKSITAGTMALAAYNILPSKWGTPIIEQIFLPAHAATSACQDVICAGDAAVIVSTTGTIVVSDTNGAPDDDLDCFFNGTNIGTVVGANPAVPTTFTNLTFNSGSNTLRFEYSTGLINGISKLVTISSGGATDTIPAIGVSTTYTICATCS